MGLDEDYAVDSGIDKRLQLGDLPIGAEPGRRDEEMLVVLHCSFPGRRAELGEKRTR